MACWLDFPSGVQAKGLGDHTNGHLCAWAGQIQNTVTQNQLNLRSTHTHTRGKAELPAIDIRSIMKRIMYYVMPVV